MEDIRSSTNLNEKIILTNPNEKIKSNYFFSSSSIFMFLPRQRFHAILQLSMWCNHTHTHTHTHPYHFVVVAKPCLTLCDPMDCSISVFSVLIVSQSLLRFMSIESVMLSVSSSVIPFSSCPQSFSASGSFPMSQFFASGGQSIGASALASVLPRSIQG